MTASASLKRKLCSQLSNLSTLTPPTPTTKRRDIDRGRRKAPRPDAERRAFECCVVELLWRNPPPASGPERCAHCDNGLGEYDGVPFLTGDGGHVWLHSGCHGEWMAHRRQVATETLMRMGIRLAAHPKGKID